MKLLIPVAVLAIASAQAQESVRTIRLRTLCFQHAEKLKEVQLVAGREGAEKLLPVRLYTSAFSDELEAPVAGDEIRFAVPSEDAADPPYRLVAKGKLVEGRQLLALFLPSGDRDMPYRVTVIDESEKNFPMGSTLIYNLTPVEGRFTIGERRREIAPGRLGRLARPTQVNDLNQATVRVFLKQQDDTWKAVSSTVWQATDQTRGLAFAYIHPRTKRPTVHCLQETPPWRLPQLE